MIKYGETYCGMLDPRGYVTAWLRSYLNNDNRKVIAPSQAHVTQRGENILYFNYPDLPPPTINQLVIPTGATRWSHVYLLVTAEMLTAITDESSGGPLVLEMKSDRGIVPDGFAEHQGIKLSMWPLPAIPIPHLSVNENAETSENIGQDGYILPLVDGRYFWQFNNTGELSAETFYDVEAMLQYLIGRVTEDVAIQTLSGEYSILPDVEQNNYEPIAPVLDSIAAQVGLTVVPDLTPASHAAADSGNKFVLMSPDESGTIHTRSMIGLAGLDGSVEAGLPQFVSGDDIDGADNPFAPESVRVKLSVDEWEVVAATYAGYTDPTVPNTELVLRYSWQEQIDGDLPTKIAEDYYDRFLVAYDKTLVGIQLIQPTAYMDCLIVTVKTDDGLPMETTRMRSIPWNLFPREPSGGTGGANAVIGHGVVVEVNCEEYWVKVAADATTTWVNGCQVLPDQDENDEITIYDPCPSASGKMAPWTETEMLGSVVQFYRACNSYSDLRRYFIIDFCITPQCDEVA